MLRPILVLSACIGLTPLATAEESFRPRVVVPDAETASQFAAAFPSPYLGVLYGAEDDCDELVNARALRMKHASYFVYDGRRDSPRTALFRERFTAHGTIAIDLQTYMPPRARLKNPPPVQPLASLMYAAEIPQE
jgi:hypothetical protein